MAQVSAADFATRWAARMTDPQTQAKIKAGVQNPRNDWHTRTIDSKQYMMSQWQASMQQGGRWDTNVGNTSTAYWQQRTINKGLPAMANGITNAKPAVQAFAAQFLPAVQQASAAAQALPRGGVENGIARAAAFIRSMAQFRYTRPAR